MRLRGLQLEARLGGGQGGEVWRVAAPSGEVLALKIRPRRAPDAAGFRQEFERLRALRLPSVVRVRAYGEDEGYLFFTMDLAEGVPFDAYVQQGRSTAARLRRAAVAGNAVATALAGIHRLGLAHRDLNPRNILVRDDGQPTLLDFGAADGHRRGARVRAGTAAYMAPEVRLGLPSDHRADSYALGVMLYEAVAGRPEKAPPGRPRPALAHDPEIPLAFSALIDRALALDPMERPDGETFAAVLSAIAEGRPLPPAPWPAPRAFSGDVATLLSRSGAVAGPPGSGRRRLVTEARYQWYRRGYRSVAGQCRPDAAFSALSDLLEGLLAGLGPDEERALLGAQASVLAALRPKAPRDTWPPEPKTVASALAAVLGRAAPLAVVVCDADEADPGTASVLPALVRSLRSDVRLWVTGQAPLAGLPSLPLAPWGPQAERTVMQEFLPDNVRVPAVAARRPLESAARGWRILASVRGQAGPAHPVPEALSVLSLLEEPFPLPLAELLTDGHLRELIGSGHVLADDTQQARFADQGTRLLARAQCANTAQEHGRIASVWRTLPAGWRDAAAIARHTLLAGTPPRRAVEDAVQDALRTGIPAEADRWLRLLDLTGSGPRDFLTDYAQVWADLILRPADVDPEAPVALTARAANEEQRAMAEALGLMFIARRSENRASAIDNGSQMAARYAASLPQLAAEILREVAIAQLASGDARGAVRSGNDAIALLERIRAADAAPTRRDVEVSDTLATALLVGSRPAEAVRMCSIIAAGCFSARMWWGEASSRARLAQGQLALGQRAEAGDNVSRARRLQPRHSDPRILARCALLQARIAIEKGDLRTGRAELDAARTIARGLDDHTILAEACALAIEAAVHAADPNEAQMAREEYGALPTPAAPTDPWPAALGRWLWLAGDLHGALQAVRAPRAGHAGLCVRAERARLMLISGQYTEANRVAGVLSREATERKMEELALFGRLVSGAAIGERDATFLPLLKRATSSPWVHLSLGGLHLDALRRRRRRENVRGILRTLQVRAEAIHHRLYAALARPEGW